MKPHARRKARSLALQAIYQWQMGSDDVANIKLQFLDKISSNKVDTAYFNDLLDGVTSQVAAIDQAFSSLLDRELKGLDPVELAVLRLATYELLRRQDVPYKVIINEALELTKKYGSIEGYKYVNGVLDKVAKVLRISELPQK